MVSRRLHPVSAVLLERKRAHELDPWAVFYGALKQRLFIQKQELPSLLVCLGSFGSEALL
jgi:hypothetical protein